MLKPGIIFLLFLASALLTVRCKPPQPKEEKFLPDSASTQAARPSEQKGGDKKLLLGDWTRTDSPYQIIITEVLTDGRMKTGYFNPKSIRVAEAVWTYTPSGLQIYVELRDQNYPGSNYNLLYVPDRDVLTGDYYQAVEGATYPVEFARTK